MNTNSDIKPMTKLNVMLLYVHMYTSMWEKFLFYMLRQNEGTIGINL